MSNDGVMANSSTAESKNLADSAERNDIKSTLDETSSSEQDSGSESSSDEGEYECSAEPGEATESAEKDLQQSSLLDESDSSSDDGDGKFNFERLESAESLEESLKEIDLSEETEYTDIPDELPSRTVNKDFIFMPPEMEYFEETEEWKSSGKWLVFNHGDLEKLDTLWIGLRPLISAGVLISLKCSTATDRLNGVIMCYTSNCEDKRKVKKAADAIRSVIKDGLIMYYKTNAASDSGFYRIHGDKFITKYMHTCACSLYERDEYNRWKKIFFEDDVV